jgi:flavin reductase (DIM6/NTAB) family NADH-FMN oxidoreductase RutF
VLGHDGWVRELPQFHELVSRLDYPMLVVTAAADGERSGCLVGFHTQCSLEPPRYLVCISRRNHTFVVAARSAHLAVHVLDGDGVPLARLFGERTGDDYDKFAACTWQERLGVPVLTGAPAWFVGRVLDRVPLGDHVGHLLEPVEAEARVGWRQLAFQQVKGMPSGHPAG